jgi:hypothetical protein
MKKLILFTSLSALVLLTSCPYGANIPLGKADACKIDSALLGKWLYINPLKSDESPRDTDYYHLSAFNATEYFIETGEFRNGELKEEAHLRAFETKIGKHRIMNITEVEKNQFTFYKFVFAGEKLNISYLSDEFIKQQFKNSSELNKFVTKNINEKTIFEDNVVFTKLK